MQKITIQEKDCGQRFDKFLNRYLPSAGLNFIYKMLRKKNILLNDKKATGREKLSSGDSVSFYFSDETFQLFHNSPQETDVTGYTEAYKTFNEIQILYEDSDVIFINKPAGILSQRANPSDLSINDWLLGYLLHTGKISPEQLASFRPSICNRLDRNTSGIILCGISLKGSQALNELIKTRTVRKFYRTFVKGLISKPGYIDGYLQKNRTLNKVRIEKENTGHPVKTGYYPLASTRNITYVEVELFTGKTHQIRAHFSSINHCLAGDYKYGDKNFNHYFKEKYNIEHQLLHAYRIEFPEKCDQLPQLSGKIIKAPLPQQFRMVLKEEKWLHGIPEV